MAGNEIKQSLRKLEFPFCAREALCRIELLCGQGRHMGLQIELINEFIFGELDRLKVRDFPVAIHELQLIDIFVDFFESPGGSPAVRNAVLLSLFPAETTRSKILGNLVSLAISIQNKAVLNAAGIWMQQLGSTSQQSVTLAYHILNDFFVLYPKLIESLKDLPNLVPHFVANLLTAIGEVYKNDNPPIELLELVGNWIDYNPSLLITSLMDNPALPTGGIPMTPITPIAGLFRWTILSSLRMSNSSNHEEEQKFYSKIQQLLMDSVLHLKNSGSNRNAISAQHLAETTRALTCLLSSDSEKKASHKELAMERLAQAISSAMSANCIYGNKQELLALLQQLSYQHFLIEWTLQTYTAKSA